MTIAMVLYGDVAFYEHGEGSMITILFDSNIILRNLWEQASSMPLVPALLQMPA